MFEHDVNVDRLALDGPFVSEHLHTIDQFHDSIGFVANQFGQGPIVAVHGLFEQLRGPTNAGERILDFVG